MKFICFVILNLCFNLAHALTPAFPKPTSGIFSSYDVIDFKLSGPISTLLKAKSLSFFEIKKVTVDGTLSYKDETNKLIEIPVQMHIKGFSTTLYCTMPKLELKLDKTLKKNTLFENVKSIDLHTHCVEQDDQTITDMMKTAFYTHHEALLYRFLDILEIPAFRARPIMMNYQDTDSPSIMTAKSDYLYQAFFLEDYGDFRRRNNLTAIRGVNDVAKYDTAPTDLEKMSTFVFTYVGNHPAVDKDDVARAVLFQHLIGNGDFFIQKTATGYRDGEPTDDNLWNMKIVENADKKWITVPQDFNLALIRSSYLAPIPLDEEAFNLASPEMQQQLYRHFIAKKPEMLNAIESLKSNNNIKNYVEMMLKSFESKIH